jgi:predicted dehydrogenase
MYKKAESVGVKHMVMFTHRWWPHIEYLKKLIDDGSIGRCYHCDIVMLWDYARLEKRGMNGDSIESDHMVS